MEKEWTSQQFILAILQVIRKAQAVIRAEIQAAVRAAAVRAVAVQAAVVRAVAVRAAVVQAAVVQAAVARNSKGGRS